jgi:hypothetical protein
VGLFVIITVALGIAVILCLVDLARTNLQSLVAWAGVIGFGALLLGRL